MRFLTIQNVFRVLRNPLLARFFGSRAELWLIDRIKENEQLNIGLVVAELMKSRSVRCSRLLLGILASIPDGVRESHDVLRRFFISKELGSASVSSGIRACDAALRLCHAS